MVAAIFGCLGLLIGVLTLTKDLWWPEVFPSPTPTATPMPSPTATPDPRAKEVADAFHEAMRARRKAFILHNTFLLSPLNGWCADAITAMSAEFAKQRCPKDYDLLAPPQIITDSVARVETHETWTEGPCPSGENAPEIGRPGTYTLQKIQDRWCITDSSVWFLPGRYREPWQEIRL